MGAGGIWHYAQKGIAELVHNAQVSRASRPTMQSVHNAQCKACQIVQNRERIKKLKICVLTLDFCEISVIMNYKKSATHHRKSAKRNFQKSEKSS